MIQPRGSASQGATLKHSGALRLHPECAEHWLQAIQGPDESIFKQVHPGKRPTSNLEMDLWKIIFLDNPVVFRFHVGLFHTAPSLQLSWKLSQYSLVEDFMVFQGRRVGARPVSLKRGNTMKHAAGRGQSRQGSWPT